MSFITQPSPWNTKHKSESVTIHEPKIRQSVDLQSKWSKMLQEFKLAHESQEQDCKIKRGNAFYKEFLKGDYLQKINVEVNLPETMLMDQDENLVLLYREKNRLKKKKITIQQYHTEIKKSNKDLQQRIGKPTTTFNTTKFMSQTKSFSLSKQMRQSRVQLGVPYKFKYKPYVDSSVNPLVPYVILRKDSTEPDEIFDKDVITFASFQQMKSFRGQDVIYQRYIFSRNLKAMVIRLCYHTNSNQSTQSDFAIRYQNKNDILKYIDRTDTYETALLLATVSPLETHQYSFQASKLVGKPLIPYQKMAKSVVNYLEKVNSIRVYKAYFDFIVDINEQIWLTNMKYIELSPSIHLNSLHMNSASITCTVYCKLCGIIHRRDDVSKTLTFKLLHQLVEHLKKRTKSNKVIYELFHNIKFNQNMNIPCQLCDVCYKLVVSQHELIEVQKQMARTMNIKINEEIVIDTINSKNRKRPAYLADGLHQWRMMLYLSEINHYTETQSNVYIQYRINGIQNLGGCYKIQENTESIFLNYIKLHYFFSQSLNIERLLNDSQLMIRLTIGPDWNKYIAQGSSGTVSHFKNNIEAGQRHSPTVLIFDNSQHYCELHLTVGLVCDGLYNTSQLNLYRQKDVYLPDPSYHNCNPLPKQWMQMFSPKYALKMMDEQKSQNPVNFTTISRATQHRHLKSLFKKK